jgi:hypothetical protein
VTTEVTLTALPALASETTVLADNHQGLIETVVVTGSNFNVDVAPAKVSLNATQPQTTINKSYIEDSAAATAVVPSLTAAQASYPSGHASVAYIMGAVVAKLVPDAQAILAR